MDVTTFQCPHCQTVLRLRGKQLTDSQFPCPDCNQSLLVALTSDGSLVVKSSPVVAEQKEVSKASKKPINYLNSLHQFGTRFISNPVLVAWTVAGIGTCLILLLVLKDQSSSTPEQKNDVASHVNETEVLESDQANQIQEPERNAAQNESPVIPEPGHNPQPVSKETEQTASVKPGTQSEIENAPELIAIKPDHDPPLTAIKPKLTASLPIPETDINAALEIPIVEFRQPKQIPLIILIRQLEEMLDTKFQLAENVKKDKRLMQTPVSFSFKNTTLSNVVKQVLSQEALTFSVKSNKIYIQKAEAPLDPDQSVRNDQTDPNPERNENSP